MCKCCIIPEEDRVTGGTELDIEQMLTGSTPAIPGTQFMPLAIYVDDNDGRVATTIRTIRTIDIIRWLSRQ
jgi:hypothetical protein